MVLEGLLALASTAYKTASITIGISVKGALATETVCINEETKKFEERFRGILNIKMMFIYLFNQYLLKTLFKE